MLRLATQLLLVTSVTATSYIATFHTNSSRSDRAKHMESLPTAVTVLHEYDMGSFFAGYAVEVESDKDFAFLRASPLVKSLEHNFPLYLKSTNDRMEQLQNSTCDVQKNVPSWGIERVSQTKLPLKDQYTYNDGEGKNVVVYVLDTGVRVTHNEFQGRASFGFNAARGRVDTDTDGHGTHVAGTVAAEHYGVCKQCNVVSVKVFEDNGNCDAAILIAAFDWVFNNYNKTVAAIKAHVINISVGGDPGQTSVAMDNAVNALVAVGVHVVGAAGNENVEACTESPVRSKDIIGVGSTMILTDTTDYFLGGCNFGKCVKIFAPGDKIVSLGISSDSAVGVVMSGTSMASPHVAGTVARFASNNPNATLAQVQSMLFESALDKVIEGVPAGTANKLVHKGCTAA